MAPMPTSQPRKSNQPSAASLKARLRKAEKERDIALWLHAEMAFKVRSVIVKQMMENPQVRTKIEAQLVERMGATGTDPLDRMGK